MDYPRPVKLRRQTTLRVEVAVESERRSQKLFSQTYTVKTADPRISRRPAAPEFRVDLSDYAGQSVDLVLRSTRVGHVVMSANERRSFGTRWQHLRIVEGR
jgi:hypothetical protein